MGRASVSDKLAKKRSTWIERTARILDVEPATALRLLSTPRKQSLRLNPLKQGPAISLQNLDSMGFEGERFQWFEQGYTINSSFEAVRDSKVVVDGAAYIQNAASWLPALVLDPKPQEYILDVCAAPGGKTSLIAALSNNQAHIWANDNSRSRLAKLQANCTRLEARVEHFTLYDAEKLAHKLEGQQFDKILIDAPCSSEGQRNIQNDKDVMGWSIAHIKRLQQLQKRILLQSWRLLKPGGTLVYSTCTMAPEENEAVVDYLLRKNPDASTESIDITVPNRVNAILKWNEKTYDESLKNCMRLQPSPSIEAFFVCKLRKTLQ